MDRISKPMRCGGPFLRLLGYVRRLSTNFGSFFVASLFAIYFGVKGLAASLAGSAALPLFMKFYGVSIERYQAYSIAVMTPWSMKPLFGLASDMLPIRGKSKVPYMLAASMVGAGSMIALVVLAMHGSCSSGAAAIFLTGVSLQAAVVDLLAEGKYAECMAAKPETGSDLATFVWANVFAGGLLGAIAAGPMADRRMYAAIFFLGIVPAAQVAAPLILGWFPDPRGPRGFQRHKWTDPASRGPILLAILLAVATGGLTVTTLLHSGYKAKLQYSIIASAVLIAASLKLLRPTVAKCNVYMFLASAAYVSSAGTLDYFYTAPPSCLENGPNFSMTYYVTWSAIVGSVAALASVAVFQSCMQEWRLRPLFWISTVLRCAAAVVDIIIVKRWNLAAGVPDKVAYMLGNNIAGSVVAQLDLMPAVILTSKLCPPGMEATMYALLAGFQNFGGAVSAALGSALTAAYDIEADFETDECRFKNLTRFIFVAHMLLPLAVVPLTWLLLPNTKLKEPVPL